MSGAISTVGQPARVSEGWPEKTVVERFERVVDLHGGRPAIVMDGRVLTYEELDRRANALAWEIQRELGDEPARVALWLEQGWEAVVCILGILKAGHMYVPLDVVDPASRREFILEDCGARLVLGLGESPEASGGGTARNLRWRDVRSWVEREVEGRVGRALSADGALSVGYTSGSTGQPKGVVQNHRNMLHYAACYSATHEIRSDDRLSWVYSLSFSASNMDLYPSLLNGAALCPRDLRKVGPRGLGEWIERMGVTVFHAVPSAYRHLLNAGTQPQQLSTVRSVDLGGEAVYASDVALFRKYFGAGCRLVNHLGATEMSVIAQYVAVPGLPLTSETCAVGKAPAPTRIWICGDDGEEAAVGETGAVVIESPYLCVGYWNRAEETAAKFSEVLAQAGWRRYRGGDEGYLDAEGNLHVVGRGGTRVKVRGFSVDLMEVEAALRAVDGIVNLAVVARRDSGEEQLTRLVAYLETTQERGARLEGLGEALLKRLPPYMVPQEFVFVASLPKTASGKVDRAALLHWRGEEIEREVIAPRDDLEAILLDIWREFLPGARVGVTDNFFLTGGDSLRAARVLARVNDLFGFALAPSAFFRAGTVERLAREVRAGTDPAWMDAVLEGLREIRMMSDEELAQRWKEEGKRAVGE